MGPYLFVNGPLDGQEVDVPGYGFKPWKTVDICELEGNKSGPLMKLVRPNKGVWSYDRTEDDDGIHYVGRKSIPASQKTCRTCDGKGYV